MKNIKWFTLITVAVLLWGSTRVNAEYVSEEKETLRGIKGVLVVVEDLQPDAIKHGLTEEAIQTDVELKLRLAGVKVLPKKELWNTPGSPYLYIYVFAKHLGDQFTYSVTTELFQEVYLARDAKISCHAITWDKSHIGEVATAEMSKTIRELVKENVDIFLNDYLAVNPIQPSTPQKK